VSAGDLAVAAAPPADKLPLAATSGALAAVARATAVTASDEHGHLRGVSACFIVALVDGIARVVKANLVYYKFLTLFGLRFVSGHLTAAAASPTALPTGTVTHVARYNAGAATGRAIDQTAALTFCAGKV